MRNGLVIIDADAHVLDLDEVYRKCLPSEFRSEAEKPGCVLSQDLSLKRVADRE